MNAKNISKSDRKASPSVLDAINGAEEMEKNLTPDSEPLLEEDTEVNEEAAPEPVAWGAFTIKVGVAPPPRLMGGGASKYKWDQFPAPSDPEDPMTWPSVDIPNIGSKSISGSIKTYRDKLQAANEKAPEDKQEHVPEFGITIIEEIKGVRVFRKS